jgi:hypothetical protein
MATAKKEMKNTKTEETKSDSLWRKPIVLDDGTGDDPLAVLYRGREVVEPAIETKIQLLKEEEKSAKSKKTKSENSLTVEKKKEKPKNQVIPKIEKKSVEILAKTENPSPQSTPKITELGLKTILKIKSDVFIFTDIREILRGKSLEIYAYLRHLSGETGVCKIKHLDLMRILDISRPTLFKQGDWLTRLSLIEKRNVPGDHFGTSYIVYRLEDVLPVSEILIEQLRTQIESYRQTIEE